jgi:membrane-bound lytic murein transglycosylase F
MGIKRRTDAESSILGGANYFQKMMNRLPDNIPKLDKIWMSLAGYNLGFVNIDLARNLAQENGMNPNLWIDVSKSLNHILLERYGAESEEFMMHEEAMQYVDRINLYYQTLSILERGDELFLLAKK